MRKLLVLVALFLMVPIASQAAELEITPFRVSSQRPLVRVFGLPDDSSATLAQPGRTIVTLTQDAASEYVAGQTGTEQLTLDGESYRWTLAARYGINPRFEVGLDVPYLLHGGGFMDGFIEGWHSTFGMPQGGRDTAPRDRLNYSYRKNGIQKLKMDHAGSGIGDLAVSAALKLYDSADKSGRDAVALRAAVKLPSGDSSALRGSGSTDVSLSLCGSMNSFTEWGTLGVFASVGGLYMTRGEVLADQQKRLAGFGAAGLGWGPTDWISFKLQVNGHTTFYRGSSLAELSRDSLMLTGGGSLKFPGNYLLDIGVSEDVSVGTAPDVALHLGLSRQF